MSLNSLPLDIFRDLIDLVVAEVGVYEAVRLRLVSRK